MMDAGKGVNNVQIVVVDRTLIKWMVLTGMEGHAGVELENNVKWMVCLN